MPQYTIELKIFPTHDRDRARTLTRTVLGRNLHEVALRQNLHLDTFQEDQQTEADDAKVQADSE